MDRGKEKERWLIETSTDGEESSDYFTSGDEDRDHIRHDGGSSADEENRLKDHWNWALGMTNAIHACRRTQSASPTCRRAAT